MCFWSARILFDRTGPCPSSRALLFALLLLVFVADARGPRASPQEGMPDETRGRRIRRDYTGAGRVGLPGARARHPRQLERAQALDTTTAAGGLGLGRARSASGRRREAPSVLTTRVRPRTGTDSSPYGCPAPWSVPVDFLSMLASTRRHRWRLLHSTPRLRADPA